ncbi:hypothetical protein PVAND_004289 [Polypedilum vanderplanki]|uniref:EGF-like domain-containing protein n=1 Tax=Polypedilum vanderplanki TaxID=319348 RepID=A0A9J6BWN9_POLVA|nr:hypothetical protein PVAND_004289 [Polypedilum vanderplanki]
MDLKIGLILLLTTLAYGDELSPSILSTEQTKVPTSTSISNQNVTNTEAITEITTLPSTLSTTENQLKLSTSQSNLITSTSSTTDMTNVKEASVTEISSSHITQEQQQQSSSSNEDVVNAKTTISFGIRSFTVEVSKSEKVDSITTAVSETTTTKIADVIEQQQSKTSVVFNDEKLNFETTTANALKVHPTSSIDILKSNLNILFNNDDDENHASRENEISNEIQIDKKLDNGLYRIKIGEITTDEFSNGFNGNSDLHHEPTKVKVNIDDFFPSKIEDFSPIIEISNEKMLKEKELIHKKHLEVKSQSNENDNNDGKSGTRINTSNVATTNIEIELIDDSNAASNSGQSEKPIEIDEIITQVEEIVTEVAPEATKVITDSTFIPRRSKKFDPSTKSNTQGPTRIHDFGMTKFNQKKENLTQNQVSNGKPEYSTTKFYNSKELYNEILHKVSKQQQQATTMPPTQMNLIREKLLNTNKIPIEASRIVTTADAIITTSQTTTEVATTTMRSFNIPTTHPRILSRLEEKLNSLDCDIQNLSADSTVWRGNETHELNLPITTPEDCSSGTDCLPMVISWEGSVDIQSGDVLIVEIDDKLLISTDKRNKTSDELFRRNTASVYQVTRLGHEHCDITEGELLDITPLVVDGRKLVTLYDKDLTEGINLLIVVSELWDQQCVRLRVNVKSDNCGENADCSGKGICFSNASMESFFCECCTGFAGQHCEEIDACMPSPCTNNGICVDLSQGHEGNSYQCLCPYGYTGKNCQFEADPCNPSQCLNGGTCISNTTHFRCECPSGFTGPLCQHNLNECESSPCVHGICVDQEDGFRCFCQPGFSGDLCNFEYNECDSNPCVNNGQCIDHIGGFSCQCTKGYQGKRCHIKIDFCANNPCEDGYRCVDHGDEYSCVCPGSNDHNVPDCHDVPRTLCTVNPCANGGTCWTSNESFYCACRPGFTGKMCEDDFVIDTVVSSSELLSDVSDTSNVITWGELKDITQDASSTDVHNAYVAAGFLATSLLILAIVVTICHCKVNGSYRRFSMSQRHHLIPYFLRRSKKTTQDEQSKHWLSGKNSSFFEENHINLKNNQQPHQQHQQNCNSLFNRPLQMNLENDMYYTVDFSESQQSPLIQ